MLAEIAEGRFESWVLGELARSRIRVDELKKKYPSAPTAEHAQRLIDDKKRWGAAGGAFSGLFGLISLPADLALVAYLQMSLIVDLAVLCGRNVKSPRARREMVHIFAAANSTTLTLSRSAPKTAARLAERLMVARGFRLLGRAFPLVAAPVTAVLNNRDLDRLGSEAMRYYNVIPHVLGEKQKLHQTINV